MKNNYLIYSVIKSMSMNEKRYFKISCGRHIIGSQNKYVYLFDVIDRLSSFDEDILLNKLNEIKYSTKFLASDLKYLKKNILKSLNDFHSDKTTSIAIKQKLVTIEILFYKGLYNECLQIIKKEKLNKQNLNSQFLMLELLNWEKKCFGYSKGLLNAIEINNEIDTLLEEVEHGRQLTSYYYQSYYLKNNVGKMSAESIENQFDEIFKDEIFKTNAKFKSAQHIIFFYLIFANQCSSTNQSTNELIYLKKALNVYKENKVYLYENPLDYISIYIRIIDILKEGDSTIFYSELNQLKNFNSIIDLQKKVVNERIFIHTFQCELEHLLINKDKERTTEILSNFINTLPTIKFKIEPYYFIKLHYLIASFYCVFGNFSSGLKHVNTILNEYNFKDRPKIFIKTEFLNIIIHYELKNYELVINNINKFKKKYSKGYDLNYIEKKILNSITKLSTNPNVISERNEFSKLKNNIDKKGLELKKKIDINYYDYIVTKSN
jgi:hypothetical protein